MIKLLRDWVLLKMLPKAEKKGSLFIVEENDPKEFLRGQVIEAGPAKVNTQFKTEETLLEVKGFVKTEVKKDDIVLVPVYAGHDIKLNGESYKLYKESDIVAVEE